MNKVIYFQQVDYKISLPLDMHPYVTYLST